MLKSDAQLRRSSYSAAAVQHAKVIPIYDIGTDRDQLFITMELVVGRSLRDIIREGRVPWETAQRFIADIAKGLECIHRAGLTHADLKPENIVVTPDGTAKILDFGLSLHDSDSTPGIVASQSSRRNGKSTPELAENNTTAWTRFGGTPGYLSPERKFGLRPTAASDLYALGVIFHELLTGRRPKLYDPLAPEARTRVLRSVRVPR